MFGTHNNNSHGAAKEQRVIFLAIIPFIILIFLIMSLIWWRLQGEDQALTSLGEVPVESIDLADYGSTQNLTNPESTFIVNGLLKADGGIVVQPTADPSNPVTGQLTFDIDGNKLKYYDGAEFVDLLDTSGDSTVCFVSDPSRCGFNFVEGEYVAGTGISILGRQVNNTGDIDPTDDITITSVLGGEVIGTPSNLIIQNNTIDSGNVVNGSITNADLANDSLTINTQDGIQGGGVVALGDSLDIGLIDCPAGFGLESDGSVWTCDVDDTGFSTIEITDGTNTETISTLDTIVFSTGAGLTVGVSTPDTITYAITPGGVTPVELNVSTAGNGLSGGGGAPLAVNTDGTTIQISGDTLSVPTGGITSAQIADNSVTSVDIQDGSILAVDLGDFGCATSQVIIWNGGAWVCATDSTTDADADPTNEIQDIFTTVTTSQGTSPSVDSPTDTLSFIEGTGINVVGDATTDSITITNTGDTNAADDLTTSTNFSGDVSGPYNNLNINPNTVGSTEIADGSVNNVDLVNDSITISAGTGLAGGGTVALGGTVSLQSSLGASIETGEITNGTILEQDIDSTNAAGAGNVLTYDQVSGGFTWVSAASVGSATNLTISDGTNTQGVTDGDTVLYSAVSGGGLEVAVSPTDTVSFGLLTTCSNGEILKWNGSAWGCQADSNSTATSSFTISDGTNSQTIVDTDTVSFFDGNGTEAVVSPTDTVTYNLLSTCANGQVLRWDGGASQWVCSADDTGVSYVAGDGLFLNGVGPDTFNIGDGAGLTVNANDVDVNVDSSTIAINGSDQLYVPNGGITSTQIANNTVSSTDITDNTIQEVDLEVTNTATDNYILSYDNTTGGFTWIDPATAGTAQDLFATVNTPTGTNPVADSPTDTLNYIIGSAGGLTITGDAATDSVSFSLLSTCGANNVLKWNGSAWVCANDNGGTTYTAGDALTLTGADFDVNVDSSTVAINGSDQLYVPTNAITTSQIANNTVSSTDIEDNTIQEIDLEATNGGTDNYVLTYDQASGGFTWVNPTGVGSGTSIDISDGTNTEGITNGDTITYSTSGGGLDVLVGPTDTVTYSLSSACSNDQVLKYNGSAWVCANDSDSSGNTAFDITDGLTTQTIIDNDTVTFANGNGTEANVSAVDTVTFNLLTTCSNNQILKWNGSAWVCSADSNGTTYIAGNGLTLAGSTFAVGDGSGITVNANDVSVNVDNSTVAINGSDQLYVPTNGITTTQIADGTVSSTDIADNTVQGVDLEVTNTATDNYILSYDNATGGFTWIDPASAGTSQNLFETISTPTGTSPVADNATDTLSYAVGTAGGLSITGDAATDTITFGLLSTCGANDVLKWNGSSWACANDSGGTAYTAGDALTLTGADFDVNVDGSTVNINGSDQLFVPTSGITSTQIADGTVSNTDLANDSITINPGTGITGGGTVALGGSVAIQSTLGTSISSGEIVDGTIQEIDLEATNTASDNYILSYDNTTGGFTWVDPAGVGSATNIDITDGTNTEGVTDGDTITYATSGGGLDVLVGAVDTVTYSLTSSCNNNNVLKWNGSAWICANDNGGTAYTAGDALTLTGADFDVNVDNSTVAINGSDQLYVPTNGITTTQIADGTVSSTDIADNTVQGVDLEVTNTATDNYILSYDNATGGFTWIDPASVGSGTSLSLAGSSGTTQTISDGDTISILQGSNINTTASATDTVTVDVVNNPTFSGIVTANAGIDLNNTNIDDVQCLYFDESNSSICDNVDGVIIDGGDGSADTLVYDNATYTDNIVLGFNGTSNITTFDTNENLVINPNGTGYTIVSDGTFYVQQNTVLRGNVFDDLGNLTLADTVDITNGLNITGGGLNVASLNCTTNANGGALTADASGNIICSDDDDGSTSLWTDGGSETYLTSLDDVIIGADDTIPAVPYGSALQVVNGTDVDGLVLRGASNQSWGNPELFFYRSRGTDATPLAVQDGDSIADITGFGYTGSQYDTSAIIEFEVDGPVTATDVPMSILLKAGPSNVDVETRLEVKPNGAIYIDQGVSLFETPVTDGTVEATRFCVGDGETNCTTDFASLGGEWTDAGSYLHPSDSSGSEDIVLGSTNFTNANTQLFASGGAVFNNQNNNVNFTVEGANVIPLLQVDGGNDRVNVATTSTATSEGRLNVGGVAPDEWSGSGIFVSTLLDSTTNAQAGIVSAPVITPSAQKSTHSIGVLAQPETASANYDDEDLYGFFAYPDVSGAAGIGKLVGLQTQGRTDSSTIVQDSYGLIVAPLQGAGVVEDSWGILVNDQNRATNNNYGIEVRGADTYALWLGSGANNTDAANGITFGAGGDTNLYRSGVGNLQTDGRLTAVTNNTGGGQIELQNLNDGGFASIDLLDDSGSLRGGIGYGNSTVVSTITRDNVQFYANDTSTDFVFSHSGSGTSPLLYIDTATDNVGIGTATPAQALDVVGTIRQTGCITTGLNLQVNGSGDIICPVSDERLKNISGSYEGGLDAVREINTIDYTFKDDPNQTQITGFSAQNVAAVIPNAVTELNNGYLAFRSDAVLAASVNAIQELDEQVQEIQSQLAATTAIGNLNQLDELSVVTETLTVEGVATIGELVVSGSASIEGDLRVAGDITVADIYVQGRIITGGGVPSITAGIASGSAAASVLIDGNDTAGTVTITTGAAVTTGPIATVNFTEPYSSNPVVNLTAGNGPAAELSIYRSTTVNGFTISNDKLDDLAPNTTYVFDYLIVE